MAGVAIALVLLAACGDRAPIGGALPSQALLAESLDAGYRQLTDPSMTDIAGNCDSAPTLAVALDGWLQGVDAAGLQSRFTTETEDVRRRAADIRSRCADAIAAMKAATADAVASRQAKRGARDRPARGPAEDPRPALTPDMLDAYARGLDEEIALMRANGTHFVSLSRYDEQGRQVAATAGLPLPGYRALKHSVHKVLYELMLHERYAGVAGQARLAGLEPHKRKHAQEVLARDPYASLAAAEKTPVQARLGTLQPQYNRYMELAAVGD